MVAITVPSSIDQQIPLIPPCPGGTNAVAEAATTTSSAIPTVDLSAPGAAAAVVDACRGVGFFRATNHGVPAGLADALEARAAAYFALPGQDKLDLSGAARPLGYGSKSIGANGDVGWLEYLLLSVSSNNSLARSSLPPALRTALEEYTAAAREVCGRVLELVAEGLGLERALLRRMVVGRNSSWEEEGEGVSDEMLRVNHYPPCPAAPADRGVTGFGEHTDPQIISLLRSNRTAGLQIKLRDCGRWVPVPSDPRSFFVSVGDSLQVLTNGRFRSVTHRVVVEAPEQSSSSRLSFIYFGAPAPSQRVAPLPQVMRDGEPRLYREFTWAEYKSAAYRTRLGDHRLGPFELPTSSSEPAAKKSTDPQQQHHHHCSNAACGVRGQQEVAQACQVEYCSRSTPLCKG